MGKGKWWKGRDPRRGRTQEGQKQSLPPSSAVPLAIVGRGRGRVAGCVRGLGVEVGSFSTVLAQIQLLYTPSLLTHSKSET